ncbi:MAG: hypothetical protein HY654_10410, partial [Acidobacteria bacterium]|nr:hypothetical protein [Acidobacteriota bacterium]
MLVSRVLIAAMTLLAAGEVGAQQCVIPPPGLVAWWPADGNVTDIVGGNSPTQTLGQPYFVSARVGQGFKFDGEAGFIVPDSPSLNFTANASFTLDAWVRIDGEGKESFHHDAFLDKRATVATPGGQRGYSLTVIHATHRDNPSAGPVVVFGISEDNNVASVSVRSAPITDNNFHFVAGVVDRASQTIALYVDGVLQQRDTIANIGDLSN